MGPGRAKSAAPIPGVLGLSSHFSPGRPPSPPWPVAWALSLGSPQPWRSLWVQAGGGHGPRTMWQGARWGVWGQQGERCPPGGLQQGPLVAAVLAQAAPGSGHPCLSTHGVPPALPTRGCLSSGSLLRPGGQHSVPHEEPPLPACLPRGCSRQHGPHCHSGGHPVLQRRGTGRSQAGVWLQLDSKCEGPVWHPVRTRVT